MLAGGAVVDRFGHRGDHVAGKIRLDTGYQRRGNYGAGHHLVRRLRHPQQSGITDLCVYGFTEKRLFLLLPVWRSSCSGHRARGRRTSDHGIEWAGSSGCDVRSPSPAGLEKHRGQRRFFGLLEPGEAFGLGRIRAVAIVLRLLLGPEDRAAQIAGQRWAQLRHLRRCRWRQLRVVGGQLLQALGAGHAVDVVQLVLLHALTALLGLQRPQHGPQHRGGQTTDEYRQHARIEAGDGTGLSTQLQ
ncbi:hypothetical protein D9M68_584460 [compost metagenome]